MLDLALAAHQNGQHAQAEALYRQLLAAHPTNVTAWHLLGRFALDQQQVDFAITCLNQALQLNPNYAECHADLGCVLESRGEFTAAIQSFRRAIELQPAYAEAQFNLANVLRQQELFPAAIDAYRQVLQLRPSWAAAHLNLGVALEKLALENPSHRLEALDCYRQAIALDPASVQAHVNLATLLRLTGERTAAIAALEHALTLGPTSADNHNLLGTWHYASGDRPSALQCFTAAIAADPNHADAHTNLATVYRDAGNLARAAELYEQALRLKPDCASVHFNRAWLWLLTGDFLRGWPEYEWRLKSQSSVTRPPTILRPYRGGPLAGRSVLVHQEQGFGDAIQFARYLPLLKARGAKVYFSCPRSLHTLLASLPIDGLLPTGTAPPIVDVEFPLLSLPGFFRTTLETIPATVPYLTADPVLVEKWRAPLAAIPGFKIGIAWQGNPIFSEDHDRSFPLSTFAPLAKIPGVTLISLQKGHGEEQLQDNPGFDVVELPDLDQAGGAFLDTAAVMQHLDLVITSDTAIAHLAGALALPVWVAIPYTCDWRWLLHRTDSPWYPTMRIFRQTNPRDWQQVFTQIAQTLADKSANHS